jgi:hypothetical protein
MERPVGANVADPCQHLAEALRVVIRQAVQEAVHDAVAHALTELKTREDPDTTAVVLPLLVPPGRGHPHDPDAAL